MTDRPSQDDFKYWAFISYSHRDKMWGDWLHKALETYRVPTRLVGAEGRGEPVPKRVFPVFRDREELPGSSDLSENIDQALRQSRYLVVICSPNAAASHWVNEEIRAFKAMGRENRVLCLIVDGEPNASDKPELGLLESFPKAVRFRVAPDGTITDTPTEPIAADVRPGMDGRENAKLKLLAGILGVAYDDLRQRQLRRRRQRQMQAAGLAALCIAGGAFVWSQFSATSDAKLIQESRNLAEESYKAAARDETELALLLALEALPEDADDPDRPIVPEAKAALSWALDRHRGHMTIPGRFHQAGVSPDGRYLLTDGSETDGAVVYDAVSGDTIQTFPQGAVTFLPDGDVFVLQHDFQQFTIERWGIGATNATYKVETKFDSAVANPILSPNGQYFLAPVYSGAIQIWDPADGQKIGELTGHTDSATRIAFSPDGNFAMSQGIEEDGTIRVWSLDRQEQIAVFDQPPGTIKRLALAPEGRHVFLRVDDTGGVWDPATGKKLFEIEPEDQTSGVFFTGDGGRLVVNGFLRTKFYDLATGSLSADPPANGWPWTLSKDGTLLAVNDGNEIDIVGMSNGEIVHTVAGVRRIQDMAFGPDNRSLFAASSEFGATRYSLESPTLMAKRIEDEVTLHPMFSEDGKEVIAAATDLFVRSWSIETGDIRLRLPLPDGYEHLESRRFGDLLSTYRKPPDRITGPAQTRHLQSWDLETGALRGEIRGEFTVNAFGPNGDVAIKRYGAEEMDIYPPDLTAPPLVLKISEVWIEEAAFSPDGKWIATAAQDGSFRLWDQKDGEERHLLRTDKPDYDPSKFVVWSGDSKRLATLSSHETIVRLWDPESGALAAEIDVGEFGDTIYPPAIPADASLIALHNLGDVALWRVADGQRLGRYAGSYPDRLEFTPDGRRLIIWASDVTIVDTANGVANPPLAFCDEDGSVDGPDAVLSPDAAIIAAHYLDTICLIDIATARPLTEFSGHSDFIRGLAFDEASSRLASAGRDGRVLVWPVERDLGTLIETARERVPRDLTDEERQRFVEAAVSE